MANFAPTKSLLRVSKAKIYEVNNWEECKHLETSGRSIDELVHRATSDRFKLASNFLSAADRLLGRTRPEYRVAVGRYYYAMYHAMRAAAFFHYRGDDYEDHTKLPAKAPTNLPNAATLANALKSARETRNHADYDPYPKSDSAWRVPATTVQAEARTLVTAIHTYLTSQGCKYL